MSGRVVELVIGVLVAAVGAALTAWANYRLQRRKERREDTQRALDLLNEIQHTVEEPPTATTPERLAQMSRRLWQTEDDAPEDVQPSLARVGGHLDSYRSSWGSAPRSGSLAVQEGTPPLRAAEDLRKAIGKARDAIRVYRRRH
ncbi:hypothetical protein ACWDHW_15110 [Streptomyces melanosporofaciens]|uniref:hypothetical protein n=1 Tax=unclassified Streptomyces TaxID=2593676 RepID=UPI0036C1D298